MELNQQSTNDTFTLFDSGVMSLSELLSYLLGNTEGITIDDASLNYIGTDAATSVFDALDLGQGVGFANPGILLTSGDGAPPRTNTESSYTVSHMYGDWDDNGDGDDSSDFEAVPPSADEQVEPPSSNGDAQLTEIAQTAFEGAGVTYDAAVLEFSFTVNDSSIRSISLDLMFGSEEYPVYINSSFVDIAAVIVNGQNYAYIDGDVNKPLSIVGATTEDGRFIDNNIWNNTTKATYVGAKDVLSADDTFEFTYNGSTLIATVASVGDTGDADADLLAAVQAGINAALSDDSAGAAAGAADDVVASFEAATLVLTAAEEIEGAQLFGHVFTDIETGNQIFATSAPTAESPLSIEYNGITPKLTISIPLEADQETYNVRIGVADTGDSILDSGLFISNLQALTTSYAGTLVNVEADDEGSTLEPPAPDTATKFVGGKGNDIMQGSTAPDVYDLQQGGANTIKGNLAKLDNDTVVGFTDQDTLVVEEAEFSVDQLIISMGSAILGIDSDNDGSVDGTVTLEGDFRKGVFITETATDATEIRFQALDTTPDQVQWVNADDSEIRVETEGLTKLLGNSAGKSVTLAEGSSVMNLAAGTNLILEGLVREDLQLLRDGTTLLLLGKEGNTVAQLAASTNEAFASTLTLSNGTYVLDARFQEEALGLFDVNDSVDPVSGVLFAGDGDRLMGSQWPTEPMVEPDLVALSGVLANDFSLIG